MATRVEGIRSRRPLRLMKKFRFQLLAAWIVDQIPPCRVADIGGGKGLLSWLLRETGFAPMVIDPADQPLPAKYRDLGGIAHKIPPGATVPRIAKPFDAAMAGDFDLLVGLHAHGSNIAILEAAARWRTGFILLPCCVIDEPIEIRPNVDWFESLVGRARSLGFEPVRFELNFRGQCRGFWSPAGPAPARGGDSR